MKTARSLASGRETYRVLPSPTTMFSGWRPTQRQQVTLFALSRAVIARPRADASSQRADAGDQPNGASPGPSNLFQGLGRFSLVLKYQDVQLWTQRRRRRG
eukprot:Plantae.Rhodophyta-Rhodochaete_pulchella.ctg1616.p1 GENE.Plantae.Rhodophyta-Rhodochaete_pulchella.ctg1616~~Plantae.Rhodophyta-Rhodochaete_pulchella.ctg1616.p1  ORF type:complete len:101 (+),score=1.02 Plantae.Rhodophyta-Rhodochaete_pulchella.ctg1616:188-490(+)